MLTPATLLLPIALSAPFTTTADTLIGKEAPYFSVEGCANEPRLYETPQLLGEVVLLKFWGTT